MLLCHRHAFRFDRFTQMSSEGLETLRAKIENIEKLINGAVNEDQKTALLTVLAAMLQKEIILLQGEASMRISCLGDR